MNTTRLSTINIVVGGLVLLSLAMLALVGIIAVDDSPAAVPEGLWTLLGGAVGALAAMLSRTTSAEPPPAAPPVEHADPESPAQQPSNVPALATGVPSAQGYDTP